VDLSGQVSTLVPRAARHSHFDTPEMTCVCVCVRVSTANIVGRIYIAYTFNRFIKRQAFDVRLPSPPPLTLLNK